VTVPLITFGIGTSKRGPAEEIASVALAIGDEEAWAADTDAFIDVSIPPMLGLNFGIWKFQRRRVRAAIAASNDGYLLRMDQGRAASYRMKRPSGRDQARLLAVMHNITGQMADNEAERRGVKAQVPKSLSTAIMILAGAAAFVAVVALLPGLGDSFSGFNLLDR